MAGVQLDELSSWPSILAATSDITAYLGAPIRDQCHSVTAVGTLEEAERGCGMAVARDGVAVEYALNDSRATFIANGRNPIFVRTHFQDIDRTGDVVHTSLLSLRVTTTSSDPDKLCDDAVVIRETYIDGIEDIAVDSLPDPEDPYNPSTLSPGDYGNIFFIEPLALQIARTPPYPRLSVVLVPILVHKQSTAYECKIRASLLGDTSSSSSSSSSTTTTSSSSSSSKTLKTTTCWKHNVTLTSLDTIRFDVAVRTDERMTPNYLETVDNCFYAQRLAGSRYFGGQDVGKAVSSLSAANTLAPQSSTIVAIALFVGWLVANGLGRPR